MIRRALESALNLLGLHYSHFRPVSRDRYEQNQALVQRARSKNGLQRGRIREDGLDEVAFWRSETSEMSGEVTVTGRRGTVTAWTARNATKGLATHDRLAAP
jgi:hypothetical protein